MLRCVSLGLLRIQEHARGRPDDRHPALLDGGDGVCAGVEVLQERQRQDAIFRPGPGLQRVRQQPTITTRVVLHIMWTN